MLESLNAVILRPDGATVTCHQGRGSLIDYVICSRSAVPFLQLQAVTGVPWTPHDGLLLRIRRDAKEVTINKRIRPRPMNKARQTEDGVQRRELSWEEAQRKAESQVGSMDLGRRADLQPQLAASERLGYLDDSIEVGKRLLAWARAMELQGLSGSFGAEMADGGAAFMGRALPPRFCRRPVLPRYLDGGPQRFLGGCSEQALLWGTLRACAIKVKRAMIVDDRRRIGDTRISMIRIAIGRDWRAQYCWDLIASAEDYNAARMAIFRAVTRTATVADVEGAEQLFSRLEAKEVEAAMVRANAAWHVWVSKALRGGAGAAHRWVNKPNAATVEVTATGRLLVEDIVEHHTTEWNGIWGGRRSIGLHGCL